MKHRHGIAATFLLAGVLLACLPVIYALHQARMQAISEKYQALDEVGLGLDRRVRNALAMLTTMQNDMSTNGEAPCSPADIVQLQQVAAQTQISIAALYLEDHRVICSSSDPLMLHLMLGPPSVKRADGIRIYADVRLPGVHDRSYAVMEKDGYALLVYPDGMLAPFVRSDLSLGLFSPGSGQYGARSGVLLDHWISPGAEAAESTHFVDEDAGFLVVRHIMQTSNTGVVVATPIANIDQRMAHFGKWFIPAGIVIGLSVLATALLLTRYQFSPHSQLLYALKKGHVFLLYQPIIDLRDNTCIGAEALLRWQYEDGTILLPDSFIPIAEDSGIIQQVTAQVLKLVERDMSSFLQGMPGFRLAVNLAASDLQSERTPELLAAMLRGIGPGCGQFVVEATERGLLEEASALSVVNAIRELGIEIAIDDFGTGYSSLAYLATYPFDILKVDKSFTSTACTEAVTSQVAVHILDLARTLGMQTLAEGIETTAQADFFRSRGVVYGQGYLFGRPMTAAELFEFVAANTRPGQLAIPCKLAAQKSGDTSVH
ncbi:EAL domain-containing protein [Stenotrophomonas sp. Iso1]|uniref:EAL domain-containing protein n=1 Tax=Stenotrophomonas sp. Iso1 TaxID=2977283 RepID=UPI0022B7AD7C|nr:EAL domain-containing protein [Stenotrophomonas sp. Iso1]